MINFLRKIYYFRRNYPRKFLLEMMPKNSICTEIGVREGTFSARILDVVKPKKLYLIDPWLERTTIRVFPQSEMDRMYKNVLKRFRHEIKKGQVIIYRNTSQEIAKLLPNEYFDWIYIDGDHSYKAVKRDLESYYSKLKIGGYIAGDDYGGTEQGVTKAVDDFRAPDFVRNHQFIIQKTEDKSGESLRT